MGVQAEQIIQVLGEDKQVLWSVLRSSLLPRLDYWIQLCYPSDISTAAVKLDNILWNVLQCVSGSVIPRLEIDKGWECVLEVPVEKLTGQSYMQWVARLPLKLGGLGLRSQVDVSPAGFIGALEQTVTSFAGERGVCPQLTHLVGQGLASDCR